MGVLLLSKADAAELPQGALKHRADLTRNARAVLGLDAPVATFASQVHQESRWRPDAVSSVGAQGIAQFMPGTDSVTLWVAAQRGEVIAANAARATSFFMAVSFQ